jgi:hypothetical protein
MELETTGNTNSTPRFKLAAGTDCRAALVSDVASAASYGDTMKKSWPSNVNIALILHTLHMGFPSLSANSRMQDPCMYWKPWCAAILLQVICTCDQHDSSEGITKLVRAAVRAAARAAPKGAPRVAARAAARAAVSEGSSEGSTEWG